MHDGIGLANDQHSQLDPILAEFEAAAYVHRRRRQAAPKRHAPFVTSTASFQTQTVNCWASVLTVQR